MRRLPISCLWRQLVSADVTFSHVPSLAHVKHPARSARYISDEPQARQSNGQQLLQYWQGLLGDTDQEHAGGLQTESAKSKWKTEDIRDLLHTAIRVRQGRVSGVLPEQLVSTFVQVYQRTMSPGDRLKLFQLLCQEFGVQEANMNRAVKSWKQAARRGEEAVLKSLEQLQEASQPLYTNLFLPFSNQPNGIKFLVNMRADVRKAVKQSPATAGPLRALDRNLRQSLATWFSVGLLQLQPIHWESSSAALLEKVMAYEAVHPMQGWQDLQQRLGHMRRVHVFMHPSMPQEPLVILHCALQQGAATSMNDILHPHQLQLARPDAVDEDTQPQSLEASTPEQADTAVFYSISSTQKGLAGVDLGNFLIKQVAQRVLAEFPNVQMLITLSPIPGFRNWLHTQVDAELKRLEQGGQQAEQEFVLLIKHHLLALQGKNGMADGMTMTDALQHLLTLIQQQEQVGQQQDSISSLQEWRSVLMRLCAHYLLHVRRRHLAFDPVANFHLRNGASVWRLNWGADLSHNGLSSSFGMMVNYRYVLEDVHSNNQMYLMDGTVPSSQDVRLTAAGKALVTDRDANLSYMLSWNEETD